MMIPLAHENVKAKLFVSLMRIWYLVFPHGEGCWFQLAKNKSAGKKNVVFDPHFFVLI